MPACVGIALDETVTREDLDALAAAARRRRARRAGAACQPARGAGRAARRSSTAGGVQQPPFRTRDAALPEAAGGQGRRAEPQHDPARVLHDEAERDGGDDPDHLARLRRHPSLRAGGPGAGLCRADRASWSDWLAQITGFAAVSLQPNAGSQGEYAGLLAIRAYHHARGDGHRDVCLIPSSAHGTNPASAVMAGMQVVVVGCDRDGNVDVADLRREGGRSMRERLAALMVTYPMHAWRVRGGDQARSAPLVHAHGGQVYMDGANMNAQVGLTSPAAHRRRCLPPEPAQDLLHPAWRRRAGRRADRRRGASRAASAEPSAAARMPGRPRGFGPVTAAPFGSAVDPADLLRLYPHDGRRRADARDRRWRS